MVSTNKSLREFTEQEYKYGFETDVEADTVPPGLNEEVVRLISAKRGGRRKRASLEALSLLKTPSNLIFMSLVPGALSLPITSSDLSILGLEPARVYSGTDFDS